MNAVSQRLTTFFDATFVQHTCVRGEHFRCCRIRSARRLVGRFFSLTCKLLLHDCGLEDTKLRDPFRIRVRIRTHVEPKRNGHSNKRNAIANRNSASRERRVSAQSLDQDDVLRKIVDDLQPSEFALEREFCFPTFFDPCSHARLPSEQFDHPDNIEH